MGQLKNNVSHFNIYENCVLYLLKFITTVYHKTISLYIFHSLFFLQKVFY